MVGGCAFYIQHAAQVISLDSQPKRIDPGESAVKQGSNDLPGLRLRIAADAPTIDNASRRDLSQCLLRIAFGCWP
jgi:hypothetical protein